jgi:flagellar biosynthesis chaperone FliJ
LRGSLKRLSALRKIQEDAESAALGRVRAHLTSVEHAQSSESLRIRSLAVSVHQQVSDGARFDTWASEVELALAPARGRSFAVLVETVRREVQHAQAAWMETRRRRLEVETLHAAAERKHRAAADRKEQKDIDEWFLLRPERKLPREQGFPET